ncbi:LysR family transcriptional regulator [Hoeflea sp. TYP-13]|uniref:LysR family transcriptional regulator n=1 Tax=Hoeflea sp. TYP-13 TaxID=3230023 RepID=UPI0034C66BD7
MYERWNWDDLRLFIAVARGGGLSMAADRTQSSAPTLGRHILALERALGMDLFHRSKDGYILTTAGLELLEIAENVEAEATKIDRWRDKELQSRKVHIAVGFWTGLFLAHKIAELRPRKGDIELALITGVNDLDLLRHQADIGLRSRRPVQTGLTGQKLSRVEFAVYGDTDYVDANPLSKSHRRFWECDWITVLPSGTKPQSTAWLETHLEKDALLSCNSQAALMAAVSTGAGLAVMPCFAGDASPRLVRCSDTIGELAYDQWLVSHDENRDEKHIAEILDNIADLIGRHRRLFEGMSAAA